MKTFKYVNTDSPIEMTIGMFEMLPPDEALNALNRINIIANNKKLGADNFGELVFNEETSPLCYTDVIACPNCRANDICKIGKDRKGNQRYRCKVCNKTFSPSSHTLSSYTNQNPGKWMQFVLGLFNGETCETLSKKCNISVPTALYWRLKVFAALEHLSKEIKLSGVIFADDTRIPYNFKGNHGAEFLAPRKAHSRGHQNTIKNVHRNTICVLCAIDSSDHSFSHCIGFGNPSGKRLSNGFHDKLIVNDCTILVTDGAQSFKRVVEDYSIPYWEKKITVKRGGKRYPNMQGTFHIQKINNYHSRLKRFLSPFKSVASRYLPGYLLLFDYMENHKNLTQEQMATNILKAMAKISADTTLEMLANQYKIPVSNGPETELWEIKIPKKEQKIYMDWYNKMPIVEICKKYKINRRKIYTIKDKVEKYGVHDKIMNPVRKKNSVPLPPLSERNWNIFLACYRDGKSYASVGRDYGVSRQCIHQIVQKILKRPESAKVKKYVSPYKEKTKKHSSASTEKEIYRDFKLISSSDMKYKNTYEILSSMHGKTRRAIERIVLLNREQDENETFVYKWTEERKTLNTQDYYSFLKERNQKIYDDYLSMLADHPEGAKTCFCNQLATKYRMSISRIYVIICQMEQGILPSSHPKMKTINPNREKIYQAVLNKLIQYPDISKVLAFHMVAKENGLSYHTVHRYYYEQNKLMQQEPTRAQEQIDEAV